MKLNHLNLTVADVQETRRFLEKYFEMDGKGGNDNIAFLTDENGMILTLTSMKLGKVKPRRRDSTEDPPSPPRKNSYHIPRSYRSKGPGRGRASGRSLVSSQTSRRSRAVRRPKGRVSRRPRPSDLQSAR
jgi:catechol 2,3-dioxygenase-like lactoylglutathione lyase family enzyme